MQARSGLPGEPVGAHQGIVPLPAHVFRSHHHVQEGPGPGPDHYAQLLGGITAATVAAEGGPAQILWPPAAALCVPAAALSLGSR